MSRDLKTTTYAGRNVSLLRTAADLLDTPPGRRVRILEAGPGLAVRQLGRLARHGSRLRSIAKPIETLIRRLPLTDAWYENYESLEILAAFGPARSSLTLLDIHPRPLRIVPRRLTPHHVETILADLSEPSLADRRGLAGTFDVVIALATIGRIPEDRRPAAAANLIAMVRPGGLVIENERDMTAFGPVEVMAPAVYRRLPE